MEESLLFGPIVIVPAQRRVRIRTPEGNYLPIHLSPAQYRILEMLAGRVGFWVPARHLAEALFQVREPTAQKVRQASTVMNDVRNKMEAKSALARGRLRTRRGFGYMLQP